MAAFHFDGLGLVVAAASVWMAQSIPTTSVLVGPSRCGSVTDMTTGGPDCRGIDWPDWLRRWDAQQEGYVPEREARFTAMLDALEVLLPESFTALDLGCGPGSISQRILARFPRADAVAIDMDPVMLALGHGALGTVGGRLRWAAADLGLPTWLDALEGTPIDAALSSTALHWLAPEQLFRLYRELGRLLSPGGVFLNADHLGYPAAAPTLAGLDQRLLDAQWSDEAFADRGVETAEQWWESFSGEPGAASLLTEQARCLAGKERPTVRVGVELHVAALREAGFREVETIWQSLSNRVLLAVR